MAPSTELNTHSCDLDTASNPLTSICELEETKLEEAKQPQRRVRFASWSDMYLVRHLNDYTLEEVQNSWLTTYDTYRIEKENKTVVRKATYGKLGSEETVRGLERLIPEVAQRGNVAVRISLSTVLREQERLRRSGEQDLERLSDSYAFASKKSRDNALKQGFQDFHNSRE